ncbi:hypothetical protein L8V01_07315 [Corynebacterium sp. c8Ua_181]|uniref:Gram-positive cocci surface proteins LPxTG domain-containing protein n=1 Tax=Corynebacterium curieae TaxID=2913500 RepID=A0A9X3MAJ8_9CORY|nr:hypothetical protein [Corynebacterium curieae]MCZ9307287.1 hypothetical protein [Corynebacterium curieae]MDV2424848.1 hypothetical protein [Corynebacterium curieae]
MKRLPQTLTAAVLTGALAFGGAAVAQAQVPMPASIETDGIVYDKQPNGEYAPRDRFENPAGSDTAKSLTEPQARAIWERQQAEAGEGNNDAGATEGEADTDGSNDSEGANDSEGNGSEGGNSEGSEGSQEDGIPAPATIELEDGTVCYQHIQDKGVYVEDRNEVNTEITDETVGKCKDANAGTTDPEGSSELSDAAKAAIGAAIALPILGGIVHYFLNKDGKTWVKSQDRVNAEPTPEEKAESEKIVAEHKDEINAQLAEQGQGNNAEGTAPAAGESADSARGMSAETGSNSVAQALAALAVAAMVAAGAFVARRKFFA